MTQHSWLSGKASVGEHLSAASPKDGFRTFNPRADNTANEYMQELPESVQQIVGTVFALLTSRDGSQLAN
jgi:hypothetical protein